jgi:UDP-N-acetylmuramoyl-tripeptide--D-alanyl-D-alanine ligase
MELDLNRPLPISKMISMQSISIPELFELFKEHRQVSTDSRNIKPNDIFFALKGETFDGNAYAVASLEKGAKYAVVDDPSLPGHPQLILVNNVLKSLQDLASFYRLQLSIPFIAITGSNGKTTTKELIHAVLATTYKTSTTKGNLNNHIGIPLTILGIPPDSEIAVIEMGANHQKEIAGYCTYTRPTHGIITNCGKAHLEGFGGVEGVRKGKGELFDFIKNTDGKAFVCADFDYFHRMIQERNMKHIKWYGTGSEVSIRGSVLPHPTFLKVKVDGLSEPIEMNTHLVGDYNIYNVLAAISIGDFFKVSPQNMAAAVSNYLPDNNRSQLTQLGDNFFIMDAYNANPSSMGAAIKNFAGMHAEKKILMLGAMAELGEESVAEHQAMVQLINQYAWEHVILVGGDFGKIRHDHLYFANPKEAHRWWIKQDIKGATVLLKGSRSTAMEKVLKGTTK